MPCALWLRRYLIHLWGSEQAPCMHGAAERHCHVHAHAHARARTTKSKALGSQASGQLAQYTPAAYAKLAVADSAAQKGRRSPPPPAQSSAACTMMGSRYRATATPTNLHHRMQSGRWQMTDGRWTCAAARLPRPMRPLGEALAQRASHAIPSTQHGLAS